jgi:hypothetical protein
MIGTNNTYPPPMVLACLQCKKEIKLITHQRAASFCCEACGSYSVYDKQKELKSNYSFIKAKDIAFKIGTVFKIDGLKFVLINYLIKEETSYKTNWIEYTLFHPVEGYWTLSESDGHYNLMKPYRYYLSNFGSVRSIKVEDKGNFQLYSKYKFKIKHAAGEFFSDIRDKELPACGDFVAPPHILSYEKTSDEFYWYLGEYTEAKTVKSWITEDLSFPTAEGIAPNQPFSLNFNHTSLIRITVASVVLLFIIQAILSTLITDPKEVSRQTYYHNDPGSQRTFVSEPFEITANNSAADFDIVSNLSNNWLETDFTLVNETTGDQYYFSGALEYYAGYTDGETWSEGSNQSTLTVSRLTKGKYHYNVLVTNDITKPFGYLSVSVIQNVPLTSNFIIVLLCLILFPVYIYFRRKRFDRKQWQNSDYSPYNNE